MRALDQEIPKSPVSDASWAFHAGGKSGRGVISSWTKNRDTCLEQPERLGKFAWYIFVSIDIGDYSSCYKLVRDHGGSTFNAVPPVGQRFYKGH